MGTELELISLSLINYKIYVCHMGNSVAFDSMKDYIPQKLL
jgi:hypothetical protein